MLGEGIESERDDHSNTSILMLSELGFNEGIADDDAVAILVSPNGSGKSIHLHKIALEHRYRRSVNVLSTTIHLRLFRAQRTEINIFYEAQGGESRRHQKQVTPLLKRERLPGRTASSFRATH